jgi:hypothetical protein
MISMVMLTTIYHCNSKTLPPLVSSFKTCKNIAQTAEESLTMGVALMLVTLIKSLSTSVVHGAVL